MEFAKIFNVGDHQMLYTKEVDSNEDEYGVKIRLDIEGASLAVTLGFEGEEKVDACFDSLSQESAETTFKNVFSPLIEKFTA